MTELRAEGVILQELNFQDYDKIFVVFSREEGLLKLIAKGASQRRGNRSAPGASPLTRAEFVYSKGKSELFQCREITVLDPYVHIRGTLESLEAAGEILQAILTSQPSQLSAPDVYQLLVSYLEKLPFMNDPHLLATSFRLKILLHDGLLALSPECSVCTAPLSKQYVAGGECYCEQHAPKGSISFEPDEVPLIQSLTYSRSFAQIATLKLAPSLREKVEHFFDEQMDAL